MSASSVQVIFGDGVNNDGITLELDEERNAGKSIFLPSDTCYIRCYPALSGVVYGTTQGSVSKIGTLPENISEYVVFCDSDNARLSGLPSSLKQIAGKEWMLHRDAVITSPQWEWIGVDPGVSPLFVGADIRLPRPVSAVLYVRYTTYYELVLHGNKTPIKPDCPPQSGNTKPDPCQCPSALSLVTASHDSSVASVEVEWDTGACQDMVEVSVQDMCSRQAVSGASVFIDGLFVGVTNIAGKIRTMCAKGSHNIRVTAPGYVATDQDEVDNEIFIIE